MIMLKILFNVNVETREATLTPEKLDKHCVLSFTFEAIRSKMNTISPGCYCYV